MPIELAFAHPVDDGQVPQRKKKARELWRNREQVERQLRSNSEAEEDMDGSPERGVSEDKYVVPGICTAKKSSRSKAVPSSSDDGTHAFMPFQIARSPGLARASSGFFRVSPRPKRCARKLTDAGHIPSPMSIQRHPRRETSISAFSIAAVVIVRSLRRDSVRSDSGLQNAAYRVRRKRCVRRGSGQAAAPRPAQHHS